MKKVIGIISTAFGCFFLLFAIGMGVVFGLVGHGISGMKDDTDYSSNEYTSCIGTIFSGMGVGIAILFGIIGIAFLITGIVLIKIANKEMKNSNTYE